MLDELRQKSRATRSLYAFWGAAGITAVIALVWGVTMYSKFSAIEGMALEETSQTAGAFSQFFSRTKNSLFGDSHADQPEAEATTTPPGNNVPAFTSTSSSFVATTTRPAPGVIIATSSASAGVRVGTSTAN